MTVAFLMGIPMGSVVGTIFGWRAAFALAALASLCIYLVCGLLADVHLFNKATKLVFMLAGLGWGLGLNTREKYRLQ